MSENMGAYSQVDYNRGYKQGRAEAIDELVDGICCNACFTNAQKDAIKKYAEQLKEQK